MRFIKSDSTRCSSCGSDHNQRFSVYADALRQCKFSRGRRKRLPRFSPGNAVPVQRNHLDAGICGLEEDASVRTGCGPKPVLRCFPWMANRSGLFAEKPSIPGGNSPCSSTCCQEGIVFQGCTIVATIMRCRGHRRARALVRGSRVRHYGVSSTSSLSSGVRIEVPWLPR